MSKKSRKRNKKILAALALAGGAAMLAKGRKGAGAVSTAGQPVGVGRTMPDTGSNYITKKINPDKRYRMLIAHANCMPSGKKLENKILSKHQNIKSHFFMDLGCGLGCHAGPGALVVGLQAMDKG